MKITGLIFGFCFLLLGSCKENYSYNSTKYNMLIEVNPWLTLNFNSQITTMKFHDYKQMDTLHLTSQEIGQITTAFKTAEISKLHGEVYFGSTPVFPPDVVKVKLFNEGKLQASIEIFPNMKLTDSLPERSEKIIYFRRVIEKVLNSNEQFKKIEEQTMKQQVTSGEILM